MCKILSNSRSRRHDAPRRNSTFSYGKIRIFEKLICRWANSLTVSPYSSLISYLLPRAILGVRAYMRSSHESDNERTKKQNNDDNA